ncbi:lipopolysaccharide transport periplasmic protein LptA [Desulfatitalea alkaliphila]|uniref:Lipopolysaccharide transport periplasmic protein LptA n=1 Tax=Desulfatitalea alkaliphila TaxID=2929485 RepID=A0AA41R5H3_9BACT|nr:lipopolysaccharide transport periplasmic protein LptA [Desulfatitalea alkaliphila]MCJ8502177.1 lipopolysaccharide transport periplasmic protein LptA [Desulfatitalea alkaliphila]
MKPWRFPEAAICALIGLALLLFSAAGALAEAPASEATDEPIEITADRLISDSTARTAEFVGNVRAVQGQTVIDADRLKIHYRESGGGQEGVDTESVESIEATGRVRITIDNRVAVSDKAVYTTIDKKLVLTGPESRITSGKDTISGSRITFFRETGQLEIVGDDGNQVKATIHSEESGLN